MTTSCHRSKRDIWWVPNDMVDDETVVQMFRRGRAVLPEHLERSFGLWDDMRVYGGEAHETPVGDRRVDLFSWFTVNALCLEEFAEAAADSSVHQTDVRRNVHPIWLVAMSTT